MEHSGDSALSSGGEILPNMRLIIGNATPELGARVAAFLGIQPAVCKLGRFADGECSVKIEENMRGLDVYVLQSTATIRGDNFSSVNDNLIELFLLLHTLKLSSAARVTAVVPYFGYSRQSSAESAGTPIGAAAVATMFDKIQGSAPLRVLSVDLTKGAVQGFFHKCTMNNLWAEEVIERTLEERLRVVKGDVCIVASQNTVPRAKHIADWLRIKNLVKIVERRDEELRVVEGLQLVGNVKDHFCIIVDAVIDSASTIIKDAELLKEAGAKEIIAFATHGLFSRDALERITNCPALAEVWVSDTVPQEKNLKEWPQKLRVFTMAPLLALAIRNLHQERPTLAIDNDE